MTAVVILIGLALWLVIAFASRHLFAAGQASQDSATREVERGIRVSMEHEGRVSKVRCQRVAPGTWHCRVRRADGHGVLIDAVSSRGVLGISVVRR